MIVFTDEEKNTYQCTLKKNNLKAIRRKIVSKYGKYLGWNYIEDYYFSDKDDYLEYLKDAGQYASLAKMNHAMGDTEYMIIGHPTFAVYITDLLKENFISQEALKEILRFTSYKDNLEKCHLFIEDIEYLDEILNNIDIRPFSCSDKIKKIGSI